MIFSKHPTVIVPLTGTTAQVLIEEALAAQAGGADVLEWRIDFLVGAHHTQSVAEVAREVIPAIVAETNLPLLLTVRTAEQGGEIRLSPGRYGLVMAELLDTLMHVGVPGDRIGLDLEFWYPHTRGLAARANELGFTVVVSHHDWVETPETELLELMLDEMLEIPDVVAKLATTAKSDSDVVDLLDATRRVAERSGRPLITLAMGPEGVSSRLEGWKYGSVATFATVGKASAPGQPTVEELRIALEGQAADGE